MTLSQTQGFKAQTQDLRDVFAYEGITRNLDWSKVSFIIWDLDGTLAPENDTTAEITDAAMIMVFREFLEDNGIHVEPEELYALSLAGNPTGKFEDHPVFAAFQERVDITEFFSSEYHARVHDALIEMARIYEMPEHCQQTASAMENLAPIKRQYILTHSSKQWTEFVLGQIGLPGFERQDRIYDYARVGFKSKAAGPEALLQICEEHNLDPEFGLFADNSSANLIPAHEAGFQTIYILGENAPYPAVSVPRFITAQFTNPISIAKNYRVWRNLQPESLPSKEEINARPESFDPESSLYPEPDHPLPA